MNPYLLNPAAAGLDGSLDVFLLNRQQWTEVQGSPKLSFLSIDGSTANKKVGLGFKLWNDADNIFNRTAFYGTYAYHLNFNDDQQLSMALSVGMTNVHIAFDNLSGGYHSDPLVLSQNETRTKPDATVGINYRLKKLVLGVVGYQLMNAKYDYYDPVNNNDMNYQLISHFLMQASYSFEVLPGKLTVAPDVIARTVLGLPLQFETGINMKYHDLIWSSAGYRPNSCVYLNLGGKILQNLTLSGAYEYNLGNFGSFTGPSWEIAIGYRFERNHQSVNQPVYQDNKIMDNLNRNMQQQSENIDKLVYENQLLEEKIKDNGQKIAGLKEEIERFKQEASFNKAEIQQLKAFRQRNEAKVEDTITAFTGETEMIVKDTVEKSLFPPGSRFNVIVGAYKTIKTAKNGQQILLREFGLSTSVIKNPESSFYFIATRQFENYSNVKTEYNRLKKLDVEQVINGEIWVYEKKK